MSRDNTFYYLGSDDEITAPHVVPWLPAGLLTTRPKAEDVRAAMEAEIAGHLGMSRLEGRRVGIIIGAAVGVWISVVAQFIATIL